MKDEMEGGIRSLMRRLDDMAPMPPSFDDLTESRFGDDRPTNRWRRAGPLIAGLAAAAGGIAGLAWANRAGPAPSTASDSAATGAPVTEPATASPGTSPPTVSTASTSLAVVLQVPPPVSDQDDRSPVQRLLAVPVDDGEAAVWSHELTQRAIQRCMAAAGLTYLPMPFNSSANPNEALVGALTEDQRQAWTQALAGDPNVPTNGCEAEATAMVSPANALGADWEALEQQIIEDAAVRTATAANTDCIRAAGAPVEAPPADVLASCRQQLGLDAVLNQARETYETSFILDRQSFFSDFVNNLRLLQEAGPQGALIAPVSSGLRVDQAAHGDLSGDTPIRWYASQQPSPETATYLRVLTYQNSVPEGEPVGCTLDDARDVQLSDGATACVAAREAAATFGRLAVDRSPFSVIIEGNATDDELLNAATHLSPSAYGEGFEVTPDGLPDGLVLTGAGWNIADFAETGVAPRSGASSVLIGWSDTSGRLLFYAATAEGPAFIANPRLGYTTVTDVTVRGVPGFVRTIASQPNYLGVVWVEGGLLYQVGSQGFSQPELVDLLGRLRPATADEWSAFVAANTVAATAPSATEPATTINVPGS